MSDDITAQERDKFIERVVQSAAGAFDIFAIYIGDKLGFYRALAAGGALTSTELAARTGTHERYVREWLEQQTVTGILSVEDATADAKLRRFHLPPGHVEPLVDQDSLKYVAPLARVFVGAVHPLTALLNAYRNGGGVPFDSYGVDLREGLAEGNRPAFLQLLGQEWLPTMQDVHARLQADPPARIADIGCGAGWSCIAMAQSYPKVYVDGFDLDEASIALGNKNVAQMGLSDRIRVQPRDASDPTLTGRYDLVTALECIHDMSNPVGVLRIMRGLAGENGAVLVGDKPVADMFSPHGNGGEAMMYGWSILHCLAVGMVDQPSAETGTVMRTDTIRRYAQEAGFRDVEILPIESFLFRFYRLVN